MNYTNYLHGMSEIGAEIFRFQFHETDEDAY